MKAIVTKVLVSETSGLYHCTLCKETTNGFLDDRRWTISSKNEITVGDILDVTLTDELVRYYKNEQWHVAVGLYYARP